ncbi:DUF3267 domain-containing protein [Natrinema halophilum]|uniref:DUF3267 domain-containing protein n=1 Tax=Natrinema halophilum TaxID=1699371 RepID=A0A7D5L036_9EURY|nr:DUF3267 domain-containing protein [Natrinema halophilum]QLG50800.1 DUF3267 domain-containing protein [Natrinema halophilum]
MSRSDLDPASPPLASFRFTRVVAIQWVVGSAVGFFAFAYCFGHVYAWIRGVSLEPIVIAASSPPTTFGWLAVLLGLLVCVIVPHELLHGAVMAYYGGSPSYGVGVSHFVVPYAYAETDGRRYTRNQLLVALLAPFVGLTALGFAIMVIVPSPLLVVPLAANAAGSIGDLWMAAILCQYPADVRVGGLLDDGDRGFGIYGSRDRPTTRIPGTVLLSRFVTGSVGTLALIATYALVAILLSLAFGSGDVVLGDPDAGWLFFRHDRRADGSALLEIGDGPLLAAAALGGLAWTSVTIVRRRFEGEHDGMRK